MMFDILLVDDDETISFIVSRYKFWKKSDFRLKQTARNGKEALKLLENESFALVIADIRMPVMDGLEMIRKMREREDNTRVILSSTYNEFKYAKEGIRLGALDFIEKPMTEEKLMEALELVRRHLMAEERQKKKHWELTVCTDERLRREFFEAVVGEKTELLQKGEEIFSQVTESLAGDSDKAGRVLTAVIDDCWKQMEERFPWLRAAKAPDFDPEGECPKQTFMAAVGELGTIASVYHLAGQDNTVSKICGLIVEHTADPALGERIAEELGLTKDYVGTLFKSRTGVSISEYTTTIKMEQAKEMLCTTNLKIYEIGERLGYATTDYFTRLFKVHTGFTPLQYRKHLP